MRENSGKKKRPDGRLSVRAEMIVRAKRNQKRKDILLAVSIMLIIGFAVGGTVAWLVARTASVENAFTPSKVTTEVVETFSGNTKSDVCIRNTGDTEAYIRAAVVVTWQNVDGDILADKPAAADYAIEFDLTNGWFLGSGGYYYFESPVKAGGETGVLITSCKPNAAAPMDGYTLHVEIIGSGIQSTPTSAVEGAWGVAIATDGTSIVK